jgi:hypothetical protein
MAGRIDLFHSYDLHVIVERLSLHDRGRIVRLIELFRRAPDQLRELTQQRLRELIASEPDSHEACAEVIDSIIEHAESELECGDAMAIGESPALAAASVAGWGR